MFSLSLQWLALVLDTSLKAALLALLAAAALRAMKLRDTNVRHRVWTGVLLGMLLLPVLARTIPALRLPLPFNLDRLTALQLDDLDSPLAADSAVATNSTTALHATFIANVPPDQPRNSRGAWPQDPNRPSRDLPWQRGAMPHPRSNPRSLSPDELVAANSLPQTDPIAAAALVDQQLPTPSAPRSRQRPIALNIIATIAVIWVFGSTAFVLRLTIGLLLALRLIRRSTPIDEDRIPTFVRECSLIRAPLTVGLLRPHVLLPPTWRTWSPAQLSAVLAHEQMHIERGDCLVLLLAQINRCLYWFHPLAWWLPQHLASLAEAACDDAVIGSTGDRTAYARHLLDVAAAASLHGGRLAPLGVSMARHCEVETRIHAILDFRRPLSQRLSWSTAILLAAAIIPLIALAAALQPSSTTTNEAAASTPLPPGEGGDAGTTRSVVAPGEAGPAAAAGAQPLTITGTILNAQGQPVPGASIHVVPQFAWLESSKKRSPRLVTKSDSAGRFEFTPQADEADKSSGAKLLIVAPEHGPEFLPLAEVTEQPNLNISLAPDDTPIRGRILTLEGQPVADAKITVNSIRALKSGDLKPYIDIVKAGNASNFSFDKYLYEPPHINATTTDAEGRFQIRGIGPNRVAELAVVSRTIQHALLNVMTVESEPLKPRDGRGFYDLEKSRPPVFGATFDWVAKPGRIITGSVVDAKTRQPIAGAGVSSLGEGHAKTDENGRFELLGCAKAASYGLLLGADDQHYINGSARIVDTPGFDAIEVTLELTRGTTVIGRVVDQATQKPIDHARLTYFPLAPNARVVRGIGGSEARASGAFTQSFTSDNGQFSIAVLPGPGFIGITAPKSASYHYQPATVDAVAFFKKENVPYGVDAPQGLGKNSLLTASADGGSGAMPAGQFNWVELLNAPDQPELKLTNDIQLIAARNLSGTVLGPDGQPLIGATVYGLANAFGRDVQTLRTSEFTVMRLAAEEKRTLVFRHDAQKLAGQLEVSADSPQPARVTLQPWAEVTGRLLDKDGAPIANLEFGPWGELKDGETRGQLPGHTATDDQGRFRLTGLVPGLVYSLTAHNTTRPPQVRIRLKPGENLDLGDIKETHEHLSAIPLPPGEGGGRRPPGEGLAAAMSALSSAPGTATDATAGLSSSANPTRSVSAAIPLPPGEGGGRRPPGEGSTSSISILAPGATGLSSNALPTSDLRPPTSDLRPPTSISILALLPTGQPAPSTHVAIVGWPFQKQEGVENAPRAEIIASGKTDDQGRFVLPLKNVSSKTHNNVHLIARGDATAVVWQKLNLDAPPKDLTLNLQAEQPVRIRLIDLEGQPAAGARLEAGTVMKRSSGDVPEDGFAYGGDNSHPAWISNLTTDQDGRATIHGLAADHGIWIYFAGSDRLAPQGILINSGMPEERPERDATYRDLIRNVKPGEEGLIPLSPAKIFEGTVRYEDTLEPAPHAKVSIWASQQRNAGSMSSIEGKTDAAGRYRISVRPGIRYGVMAYAPTGSSYLIRRTTEDIRWENGDRIKQVDVVLPRGVLVRGKVLTAGTHEPIADAAIQFIPQNAGNRPQLQGVVTGWQGMQHSAKDGSFEIAIPPVSGHLLVNHDQGSYVLQETSSLLLSSGKPGGERNYVHAIYKIDPAPDTKSLDLTIELQPGATVAGRIVDPQGQPAADAVVISRLNIFSFWLDWHGQPKEATDGRFELKGLNDGVEYPTHFLDAKRRLGATVSLKASDQEPTITLEPCGSATVRFLDEKGQPLVDHRHNFEFVITPGVHRYDFQSQRSGQLAADSDHAANIDRLNHGDLQTDADGKLTIPALIPGATYALSTSQNGRWRTVKEFKVQSGETLDLGEITAAQPQEK